MGVQRNTQIEANTRFGNFKGANIFKVAKETIKQMKRLKIPRMVNGDDRNDMEDMEDMENMEHQGENEDHVLTTMEKNRNRKTKYEKIKSMLIEVLAIHEALAKNFFESNLEKKCKIAFTYTLNFGSKCDE